MTVPQRRLAGLWRWLLMAALQVVFGQTGLELAAAVETDRSAVIKVTLVKHDSTAEPTILKGDFVGGSEGEAKGRLMQMVALDICERDGTDMIWCRGLSVLTRQVQRAVLNGEPDAAVLACRS
ncbi:hypothetical protein DPEC_G00228310 [Dallia pectoralis]|uniref:Uncharacterized protein n=1 Tax=Dallia pectoralis TaxID=75939 RepID=A0ACC2G0V4_DALPE|nr:hypothetical protein DPEC_G00228310 [Dallia pectoralis]